MDKYIQAIIDAVEELHEFHITNDFEDVDEMQLSKQHQDLEEKLFEALYEYRKNKRRTSYDQA